MRPKKIGFGLEARRAHPLPGKRWAARGKAALQSLTNFANHCINARKRGGQPNRCGAGNGLTGKAV